MSVSLEHAAKIVAHAAEYAAKHKDEEIGISSSALAMLGYGWALTGESHLPSRRKVRRAVTKAAQALSYEASTWTSSDDEAEGMAILFIGVYLAAKAAKVNPKEWKRLMEKILRTEVWSPDSPLQETWQNMSAAVPVHVPEPKWRDYVWYRRRGSLRRLVRVEP